jgi:hypothetical protein
MPPLPAVPQVVLFSWKWSYGTDIDVVCRAHFRYTGAAPGPANLLTWLTATDSGYVSTVNSMFSTAVTLTQISCADLSNPTAGFAQINNAHGGNRSGAPLDANTAVLINWAIARRYRGGKPRTYLPAGTVTDLSAPQAWVPASVSAFHAWVTYMGTIISNYPGPGTVQSQVNVSYYQGSTASITGSGSYMRGHTKPTIGPAPLYPLVDNITSGAANPKPATQRRRSGYSR